MDGPRSPITVLATRSQLCSVQPPHGPESIGSDWTRVGRKASILLCIIVIVIFFPPMPTPGSKGLGDFSSKKSNQCTERERQKLQRCL